MQKIADLNTSRPVFLKLARVLSELDQTNYNQAKGPF